jgi:hypothetical protein
MSGVDVGKGDDVGATSDEKKVGVRIGNDVALAMDWIVCDAVMLGNGVCVCVGCCCAVEVI